MSTNSSSTRNISYGLNNPLQSMAPIPVPAKRDPTSADIADVGTVWANILTNAYWVLTSPGVWTAQSTGSATQASIELTGGSGTVLKVDAGGATVLGGTLSVTGATTLSAALTVNSGAGAIGIGTDAVAKTITVGNGTGATDVIVNSGTGGVQIGTNAVAHTITVGNSTGATAIDLNAGSGGIGIASLAVAQPVIIGNNTGASSVTILGGTGGSGFIDIGNAAHEVPIIIGNTTTGTSVGIFTDATIPVSISSFVSVNGVYIIVGAGDPNTAVTAPIGSLYLNSTGSTTTNRMFINTNAGTVWTYFTSHA